MSAVKSIRGMNTRLNVVGRIRAGAQVETRSGRKRPSSIDTFRFTSQDLDLIRAIATEYGGEPREWIGERVVGKQWEVTTNASKIDILLPPNCLDGPVFELWSGGGRMRRCDTENCEVLSDGPDGPEYNLRTGCQCEAEARKHDNDTMPPPGMVGPFDINRACSLKMRLTVLLPQFQMAGGWRIDTGSRNAAEKIPAMVDVVQNLQSAGLPAGFLYIMKSQAFGGRREFNEILVGLKQSYDEIQSQLLAPRESPVAIATPERPQLTAADVSRGYEDDDDPIDAEVVDDGPGVGPVGDAWTADTLLALAIRHKAIPADKGIGLQRRVLLTLAKAATDKEWGTPEEAAEKAGPQIAAHIQKGAQ